MVWTYTQTRVDVHQAKGNAVKVYFEGGPLDGRTEEPTVFMTARVETGITQYQWSSESYLDHHGEQVRVWKHEGAKSEGPTPSASSTTKVGQVYRDKNCKVGARLLLVERVTSAHAYMRIIQAPLGFNRGAQRLKLYKDGRLSHERWQLVHQDQEGCS